MKLEPMRIVLRKNCICISESSNYPTLRGEVDPKTGNYQMVFELYGIPVCDDCGKPWVRIS